YRTWWTGRRPDGTTVELGVGYEDSRRAVTVSTLSRTKQRCQYSAEAFSVREGRLLVSPGKQKSDSPATSCAGNSPTLALKTEGKETNR
ncbi:hypothetical protein ACSNOI_48045, partial [Actinomadura kijaniata]